MKGRQQKEENNSNNDGVDQHVDCLMEQGFPRGLAHSVYRHCKDAFACRIWVLDNSGSMNTFDGRRLYPTKRKNHVIPVQCTRWDELKECVQYHAQMAALLQAPTKFVFLNPPAPFGRLAQSYGVAEMGHDMIEEELESLFRALSDSQASGGTPLTQHLLDIYATLEPMKEVLRRDGQRVVVCLATDGLPTDEQGYTGDVMSMQFEQALQRLLRDMPVWLVIRLCTNDESTIRYYEQLDSHLELDLELLDDYFDEAKEVKSHNPWLTYGLSLHRCREMGFHHRLFDLLDERRLTMDELGSFLRLVFGDTAVTTDPHLDWEDFVKELKRNILAMEEKTYNPIVNRLTPWINIRELERCYGPRKYHYWIITLGVLLMAVMIPMIRPYFDDNSIQYNVHET